MALTKTSVSLKKNDSTTGNEGLVFVHLIKCGERISRIWLVDHAMM